MAGIAAILGGLAVAAGAIGAGVAAPVLAGGLKGHIQRVLMRERMAAEAAAVRPGGSEAAAAALEKGRAARLRQLLDKLIADGCRNGVPLLRRPLAALQRHPAVSHACAEMAAFISARRAPASPQTAAELAALAMLACAAAAWLLFGQPLAALLVAVLPPYLLSSKAAGWRREQRRRLREQLPDALIAIGMCFSAGYSLEQALAQTAEEADEPLRSQLAKTANDMRSGCSIAEALGGLEQRTAMADIRFITAALEVQHTTGGSLRDILTSAADSITASFDLERSLEVQTAQARLSAKVVSLLPLFLVAMLSLTMEGYLETFFSSAGGLALLVLALAMEAAGILTIRRILKIDLE